MAMGIPSVSGGEPEYYDFIGEPDNRPIIHVDPMRTEDTVSHMLDLINDREALRRLGAQSRAFVERHNSYTTVASRFIDFYHRRLSI